MDELVTVHRHLREVYENIHETDIFEKDCYLKTKYEKGIDEIVELMHQNDKLLKELMKIRVVCEE